LEDEAVAGAIDLLLEDADSEVEEVDVTIYAGVTDDEAAGKAYGAVVAIATRAATLEEPATRGGIAATDTVKEPQPKDLQLIEGIGPKIAELLNANDIYDLADLAGTSVERLRAILGGAGRRFRLADPASWPEQAKLGASGMWEALTELQSRLRAGR
jgi:predicted flap endonuclease-1-like 5' DNA nuclease